VEKPITYGLWDTQEKGWMSNGDRPDPNTYTEEQLARAAATICSEMLGYPLGRIRALPFTDNPEDLVVAETMEAKMTAEEAVDKITGRKP
jgi:hypothetical protein